MSRVLICLQPARGHVGPTAPLARALVAAGHEVSVITGARYLDTFADLGARTLPLPPEVDFDDTDLDGSVPGRAGLSGMRLARFDLTRFVEAMPHQLRVVDQEIARGIDVVLCDPLFLAGMQLVLSPRASRPRVLALGFLPLMAPLPAFPPTSSPITRARNATIRALAHRFLRPITRRAQDEVLTQTGVTTDLIPFDWPARSDGVLQFTAPGFEYPRDPADVPAPIHLIGPLTSSTTSEHALPPWWDDLDGTRPVVHVTQGTIANADLGQLLAPTITGLAEVDVLVVATTCGGPLGLDRLPPNVRVADFLGPARSRGCGIHATCPGAGRSDRHGPHRRGGRRAHLPDHRPDLSACRHRISRARESLPPHAHHSARQSGSAGGHDLRRS